MSELQRGTARRPPLTQSPAWRALVAHCHDVGRIPMRELFQRDPRRFEKFSIEHGTILLDYSKNRITDDSMRLLVDLALQQDVPGWTERMFSGDRINNTENRAVLHTALRNRSDEPVLVDGVDVMPAVRAVLDQMRTFSRGVRSGEWRGFSGKPVTDIVNIGIGGSDLGPALVTQALQPFHQPGLHVHFVSNVEGSDLADTLERVNPETTLFVVASKTFTTWETMANAHAARDWLLASAGDGTAIRRHFVALSANREAAVEFGIDPDNIFGFWDWVGGRYSLWSAIGLSIVLYIGMENFEELLQGAFEMDRHFRGTPLAQNMPVVMALLGVWYNNFLDAGTLAILPYEQHLRRLPSFLRQLDMESNGKRVTRDGLTADYPTGPVVWGEIGGKGQHAFYQLLHQGARLIPADFLVPVDSFHPMDHHHEIMLSNALAQTEALMRGKSEDEARFDLERAGLSRDEVERLLPHKVFPGNNPSNTLMYRKLTPRTLGALIALYEHKVFVQGVIWNVNSFDQMGVELGKQLAQTIFPELSTDELATRHDASTNGLINYYRKHRSA